MNIRNLIKEEYHKLLNEKIKHLTDNIGIFIHKNIIALINTNIPFQKHKANYVIGAILLKKIMISLIHL